MTLAGRDVLILGGSGLVGVAIARRVLGRDPAKLVVASLEEAEAREAVERLRELPEAEGARVEPAWGDVFVRDRHSGVPRSDLLETSEGRAELLEDIFGPVDAELHERSELCRLLVRHRPDVLVDCINTATAIAYQDVFTSAKELRKEAAGPGGPDRASVEAHLTSLYLPQLIRHIQLLHEALRRAGTEVYLKIGTSGTGGMGLNVPYTHSEERPSATLLAKACVAGAHSLLLYLMARTPDGPAVKEVKPTAAVAWKRIDYGPIASGGEPIPRIDATEPLSLEEAFGPEAESAWREAGEPLESVYLDAGENGLFSLSEFESISGLGMMEFVTPEEIADTAIWEIEGRPTGSEIVAALDGASSGPTYRAGTMREAALRHMEALEEEHDVRSVAFEMLGPPRLSKLLFEAEVLARLYGDYRTAADLDPARAAERSEELLGEDDRLRSDVLSIGLPILLPDGERLLRGREVKVPPDDGPPGDAARLADRGWVDLRPASWERWVERCRGFLADQVDTPGPEAGSAHDLDVRARSGDIRPGALAAHVFRSEDEGRRIKR